MYKIIQFENDYRCHEDMVLECDYSSMIIVEGHFDWISTERYLFIFSFIYIND